MVLTFANKITNSNLEEDGRTRSNIRSFRTLPQEGDDCVPAQRMPEPKQTQTERGCKWLQTVTTFLCLTGTGKWFHMHTGRASPFSSKALLACTFHPDVLPCQFFRQGLLRDFILKSSNTRKWQVCCVYTSLWFLLSAKRNPSTNSEPTNLVLQRCSVQILLLRPLARRAISETLLLAP